MWRRFVFPLIALFWVVMNVLLWRSEFGALGPTGDAVSTEVVLHRILTAPDDSTLVLTCNGSRIGYCHWYPDPGDEAGPQTMFAEDYVPEGRVKSPRGYILKLDGNVVWEAMDARFRFNAELRLTTNQAWQVFTLRVAARPMSLEVKADALARTLSWRYDDGEGAQSHALTFDELADSRKLVTELGAPWALALATQMAPRNNGAPLSAGLAWAAQTDWFQLGRARIRAYRLQARLADRYQAVIYVNRVGEILRVELPNGVRLANESIAGL
jgi:hypothetical protein